MHPAQLPIEELLAECEVKRTRGSGPGGQHRNKVETAVVITHLPTGIRGEAAERRSQNQNYQNAIQRLRVRLGLELRTQPAVEISLLWRRRVTNRRVSISKSNTDFPALLAEVLNQLDAHGYSTSETSNTLGINTSQLIKFLKVDRAALAVANRERQRLGKQSLR